MTTRVATIAVHGLKTPSQWVNKLVVECATDQAMTQVVATATSGVEWDGSYNNQKDYISFPGLTYGVGYYLRAGAMVPITNTLTWSPVQGIQAGTGVAVPVTYNATETISSNGVHVQVTPNSPPSNIDHYEAYWNFSGTYPTDTTHPLWVGQTGSNPDFFVAGRISDSAYVWLRAVTTDHIPQTWSLLPIYGIRVLNSQNGEISPWGSLPPIASSQITYVASTSGIAWYWNGLNGSNVIVLYKADGGTFQVGGDQIGVTGLSSGTTYYFYPYYYVTGNYITFVAGGIGSNDASVNTNGAPGANIAYTSPNLSAAAYQVQWSHVPLSTGAVAAQTASSGTTTTTVGGSGGGGSYSGGGGCPKRGMVVMTKTRGIQKVEAAHVGEWIKTRVTDLTPDGWTQVLRNEAALECEFGRVVTNIGGVVEEIEQSLMTPMPLARGNKLTSELGLSDLLIVDDDDRQYAAIRKLEVTEYEPDSPEAEKRILTCDPSPEFFCGKTKPVILTHNMMLAKY